MKKTVVLVAGILLAALTSGCTVWDSITESGTDTVYLKGESGQSCSLDSECRSNSCVYPGICE